MDASLTLLIVCAVLGGLVIILGLIYAYIHCFKLNHRSRSRCADDARAHYHAREGQLTANETGSSSDANRKKTVHPFLLWGYAAKFRKDSVEQQ